MDAAANDPYLSGFQTTLYIVRMASLGAPVDWWRNWFGAEYLGLYDKELAARTPVEIDRLQALLQLRPPNRILDLPCGQGRHAIELAKRGYDVTAVDLSAFLLGVGRERAATLGVRVRFFQGDMREVLSGERFQLVLNLFTSFGYFADAADDRKVAVAAAAMLEPGGRFVVELINGDRLMRNFQDREWFTVGEATVMERRSLDRQTRVMTVERTVSGPAHSDVNHHAVRLYGPPEIERLLRDAGFAAVDLYGDWDGSPATQESLRVVAIATTRPPKPPISAKRNE
jgi:SAM-dependent methyltransferase